MYLFVGALLAASLLTGCKHDAQAKSSIAQTDEKPKNIAMDSTPPAPAKDSAPAPDTACAKALEGITKEYLMGKYDPAKDPERFVLVKPPYSVRDLYARKETFEAFKKMREAAAKDGISLTLTSCVRNFDMQKGIWEAKWRSQKPVDGKILPSEKELGGKDRALKILLWNSMPGTSRHHWGTDIDMNSVEPAYFERPKGKKEYEWLQANAPKFGFCQTYSPMGEQRPTGYQEEKWHWSYLPLAQCMTKMYAEQVRNEDITGFVGCETAKDIDVVQKYVLGINPACK